LGNQRIAIVDNEGTYLNFSDHLNSSSVTTDLNGNITNLIDYLPFGIDRVNVQLEDFDNTYKFTDQEKDNESDLMNFDARQYNQNIGRFLSQDPLSLKIALAVEVKNTTGQEQQKLLQNPQVLNGYAYAGNNPVKYTDPDGQFFWFAAALAVYFIANTVWDLGNVGLSAYYFSRDQSSENAAFLSADLYALSNLLIFGGMGAYKTARDYKQSQEAAKLSKVNEVIKLRHITDKNYSEIMKNGFNANRKIYTLDMNDSNSKYASMVYDIDRSKGIDYGRVDLDIPTNVFKDLESKGLVGYKQKYIKNVGEYKDIYFLPEAAPIINLVSRI